MQPTVARDRWAVHSYGCPPPQTSLPPQCAAAAEPRVLGDHLNCHRHRLAATDAE